MKLFIDADRGWVNNCNRFAIGWVRRNQILPNYDMVLKQEV